MLTVIGAVNIDIVATAKADYRLQDSNPAAVSVSVGGVAMNYARNLRVLGEQVRFITLFADDALGQMARNECEQWQLDLSLSATVPHSRANIFVGINNHEGDLEAAACDVETLETHLTREFLSERIDEINCSELVLLDTNLTADAVAYLLDHCTAPIMMDSVSTAKTQRLVDSLRLAQTPHLHTLKVNAKEYAIIEQAQLPISHIVQHLYITLGADGVRYVSDKIDSHFPALQAEQIVSTLGAGDAFLSGLAYAYIHHIPYPNYIAFSQRASLATMAVEGTINPQLKDILLPL